jgi:tetratricopeptide (TPR) repeat protein
MTTTYDYDLCVWDTVGGAYTSESMAKASGGSEKEVVQLAEGLAKRGLNVLCLNQTTVDRSSRFFNRIDDRDHEGAVRWENLSWPRPVRCKTLLVQRYSTLPDPSQVLADRILVRATDVYGDYYKHAALTHLCVSNWQAKAFREAAFPCVVIPAMLDDDYYELAKTPKVRGRFIFASAAMKGLNETLEKWADLEMKHANEMAGCELHVTSPGYGDLGIVWDQRALRNVKRIGALAPRDLAKYMATCEGLFYVNTFPETFCAVAAIAEAVGCRTHIWGKNGLAGIREATMTTFAQEDEEGFEQMFIGALRGRVGIGTEPGPPRFAVSTVLPQWLAALKLDVGSRLALGELRKHVGFSAEAAIAASEKQKTLGYEVTDRQMNELLNKTPTVCLVMLAKNAESTIRRALESVKHFVDHAIFQFDDEASSEKMRSVIDEVFEETGLIPAFTFSKWENFSVNRNLLLATAYESFSVVDYILTLDADDEFVNLNSFAKNSLVADCYSVKITDGSTEYERPMLWLADKGYHYRGPAHEYLTSETPGLTAASLSGVSYRRHGQNLPPAQHREKYLRDVHLFVAELRQNPEDARSTYYLGQSLEDASCGADEELLRQAMKVFEARAKMNHGFPDEQFLSFMKLGRLHRRFKEGAAAVEAFRSAMGSRPDRAAEALFELANYYNNEGKDYKKALESARQSYVKLDRDNPPKGFLVEPSVYAWKLDFECGLAEYYSGNKELASGCFNRALKRAPAEQHETLRKNLEFCKPPPVVQSTILDELEQKYGTNGAKTKKEDVVATAIPAMPPTPAAPVPWFTPKS